jgi:serine/threonine-protein kinase
MTQIPGFEIIERLGAGGMAEVWKARQVSLDRIVAVKVLSAQFSQAPDDVKRFQREAQSAAKLKHPGIVQVYDANAVAGTYYFVMEFVAGYTAGEWLRRKGVVPEKDALLVAECVADALGYAWDTAHIIHCDIKPDNLMVDADGSVKVTDLGLARTISAMSGQGLSEEVLGTPAYMPPEQARGETDLDFRADIYALGATLYHMLTGKLLFHGNPDERVMEMQVSDTVSDPIDVNPSLSKGVSWLLEKMMAKDRNDRHESWQAVRADLARVRNGMMPHGRLAPKAASTVTRSSKRAVAVSKVKRAATVPTPAASAAATRSVPMWVFLVVLGIGALLVALLLKLLEGQSYTTQPQQAATPVAPPEPEPAAIVDRDAAVRDLYERTRQWVSANPGNYDEAIARYRVVAKKAADTATATLAHRAIRELADARQLDVHKTGLAIRARADELAKEKGPAAAADYLDTYSGPYAGDTLPIRLTETKRYREEHALAEKAKRERDERLGRKYAQVLDAIAADILDRGLDSARNTIAAALSDPDLAARRDQLEPLKKLFDAAADMDTRILNSFLDQRGQNVTVQLSNGTTKSFRVEGVQGGKVFGPLNVNTAVVMVEYCVRDLSVRERLQRMGTDTDPAVALVKGQMAFVAKAYAQALTYFRTLPEELAQRLVARVSGLDGAPSAAAPAGDGKTQAAVVEERPAPVRVGRAPAALRPVSMADAPESARKAVRELLSANRQIAEEDIGLAVDPAGAWAGIEIRSPDVHDLGALSGGTTLRSVVCGVVGRQTALGSLVALRGLPLERLRLAHSSVKDLSSLRGMPLVELDLSHTPVSDLDPLRGMPLEHLSLNGTAVRDLAALRGLPLVSLDIGGVRAHDFLALNGLQLTRLFAHGTQLRDAAPIQNMPLRELDVGNTELRSFDWMQPMPLEVVNVENTQIRDLGPLKGKRLRFLNAARTGVSEISVLRDMPLTWLSLAGTTVSDLSPLKGAPLKELNLSDTHVSDLEPLRQLPIENLNVAATSVDNLDPLGGMPLRYLDVQGTKVRDLSAVAKLPLVSLNCQKTRIRSLHALNRSPIQQVWLDATDESSKSVLRSMPNLRTVNGVAWTRW